MNHSQWKTRRARKLLGDTVEESQAYVVAKALDASLTIDLAGDTSRFRFTPREGHHPDGTAASGHSSAA